LWQQANGLVLKQSYLDLWTLRSKVVEETGHQTHRRAVNSSEAKGYRLFPSACPESRFKASRVSKQGSGVIQKNDSVARQGDAAGRSIDESGGQIFFQKLDMTR
jgi:hypothetical protein